MRRVGALAAAALAVALVLVAVARWERGRHADEQNAGIAHVYREVGELDAPNLEGFRVLDDFQCLIYRANGRRFGLELCVDWDGRVVEAMDRRTETKIWSLREDAEHATVRVDRREFERVIDAMCDQCAAIFERARQPGGVARR